MLAVIVVAICLGVFIAVRFFVRKVQESRERKQNADQLDTPRSTGRSLLVRRRDAEDLVLTTVSRAEQAREASSVTTRMFVALMHRDPRVSELVSEILPEVFPWVAFLSHDELHEFVVELVSTMRAADSIDNPTPVIQVIQSWRHTAEVLADPELAAVLSMPSDGDYGAVPEPGETLSR